MKDLKLQLKKPKPGNFKMGSISPSMQKVGQMIMSKGNKK